MREKLNLQFNLSSGINIHIQEFLKFRNNHFKKLRR